MKRLLLLIGSIVTLVGSLGMAMFGSELVGIFEVLTFKVVDSSGPPPVALAEFQWAVVSAMTLVLGLLITAFGFVVRDGTHVVSTLGKGLSVCVGVLLVVATLPLLWGIWSAKQSFWIIATSESAPTPEALQEMLDYSQPIMTVGGALYVGAALLFVVAVGANLKLASSSVKAGSSLARIVIAVISLMISSVSLLLLAFIWSHGSSLSEAIGRSATAPDPAELAGNLSGILIKSLAVFAGIAMLGMVQPVACIVGSIRSSTRGNNNPD